MVRMRRTVTPSARSSRVRNGELVSTTFPERISLPMTMMPAVRSTDSLLHRDRVLAEVARADADVDERRLTGAQRALERGANVLRPLDPLAVPAERLDHPIVAAGRELAGGRAVGAVHLHLAAQDLRPRRVVPDHAHDVDLLPDAGLELHHVEAEGPVAVHDDDVALGRGELGRHGVAGAGAERAERACVEPVAEAARAEHVGGGADEVAAVADHDGVGREQPVHLGAQAERVDGRLVGGELRRERRPLLLLEPAQLAEPAARQLGLPAGGARALGERPHGQPGVADDADVAATVLAELAAIEVDVDQLGGLVDVRAAPVADPEVERGAEDEHHVGALERVLARLQEPVRVLGVERAARLAVHVDRHAEGAHELRVRLAPARPEELAPDQADRTLRPAQEAEGALHVTRVTASVSPGPAVTIATPGCPVTRAQPSAACAADCSWRTSTMPMPSSRQPS